MSSNTASLGATRSHLLWAVLAVAVVGGLASLAAPAWWTLSTRALVAWDAGVLVFLAATAHNVARSDHALRRRRALEGDPGALGVLATGATASFASLAAIFVEAARLDDHRGARLALCATTVVLSFVVVHTSFGLHYAHEHEREKEHGRGGLRFAGEAPDYVDFLYFAFVIGVAAQTADVSIESRRLRRFALVHGVFSFFFNTSVLALAVSAAAAAF